jgi:regulator of protease activity HflC (stomatin/prohibitin superfamily)
VSPRHALINQNTLCSRNECYNKTYCRSSGADLDYLSDRGALMNNPPLIDGPLMLLGILAILAFILIIASVFTVEQQTVAIVERFSKFSSLAHAGLNFRLPLIDWVVTKVSLRTRQLIVKVETKTKDNVFVHITVALQYMVRPDKVYEAFYTLADPEGQMTAFLFDVVRAHVPSQPLDDVFAKKDEVAEAVKTHLAEPMEKYGYQVITALVTDVDPDSRVKDSMNEINANQRLLEATKAKSEADKLVLVKRAEAEAESKALQGKGVADERLAIARGLREAADLFQQGMPGSTPEECMAVLLMTQYFDMLKDVGAHSTTIMLPYSPGGMTSISEQITQAITAARQVPSGSAHGGSSVPSTANGSARVTTT